MSPIFSSATLLCKNMSCRILNISSFNFQQLRNTYILRRRYKPHLVKTHEDFKSRKLRARHFIYDLVEDTDKTPPKPVKLLLLNSVAGIGVTGEIVEVKPNKARTELLLPGLAVYASPENIENYSEYLKEQSGLKASSPSALMTAKYISMRVISVCMNMHSPWEIEKWHIKVALRKAGIVAPEGSIAIPENPIRGPDLRLQHKEFLCHLKINNQELIPFRCRIHHISSDARERIPWKACHWEYMAKPLFSEQAEELNKLALSNPYTRNEYLEDLEDSGDLL